MQKYELSFHLLTHFQLSKFRMFDSNIKFFRGFDKENYVLYEFVDREYIGYHLFIC